MEEMHHKFSSWLYSTSINQLRKLSVCAPVALFSFVAHLLTSSLFLSIFIHTRTHPSTITPTTTKNQLKTVFIILLLGYSTLGSSKLWSFQNPGKSLYQIKTQMKAVEMWDTHCLILLVILTWSVWFCHLNLFSFSFLYWKLTPRPSPPHPFNYSKILKIHPWDLNFIPCFHSHDPPQKLTVYACFLFMIHPKTYTVYACFSSHDPPLRLTVYACFSSQDPVRDGMVLEFLQNYMGLMKIPVTWRTDTKEKSLIYTLLKNLDPPKFTLVMFCSLLQSQKLYVILHFINDHEWNSNNYISRIKR